MILEREPKAPAQAATPAPAAPPPPPSSAQPPPLPLPPLQEAEQFRAWERQVAELDARREAVDDEDQVEALGAEARAIEALIADTPATTRSAMLVKARLAAFDRAEDRDPHGEALIRQLIAFIERPADPDPDPDEALLITLGEERASVRAERKRLEAEEEEVERQAAASIPTPTAVLQSPDDRRLLGPWASGKNGDRFGGLDIDRMQQALAARGKGGTSLSAQADRMREIIAADAAYWQAVQEAEDAAGLPDIKRRRKEADALEAELDALIRKAPTNTLAGFRLKASVELALWETPEPPWTLTQLTDGVPPDVEGDTELKRAAVAWIEEFTALGGCFPAMREANGEVAIMIGQPLHSDPLKLLRMDALHRQLTGGLRAMVREIAKTTTQPRGFWMNPESVK